MLVTAREIGTGASGSVTQESDYWEPLCYAQIGGLTLATFITLLLRAGLYSILVLDLKLIRWDAESPSPTRAGD